MGRSKVTSTRSAFEMFYYDYYNLFIMPLLLVTCDICGGKGKCRCTHCGGTGHVTEYRDGKSHRESCGLCFGSGSRICFTCSGSGRVTDRTCDGQGTLRHFDQMTRTHVTLLNERVVDDIPDEELPPALIKQAQGNTILEKTSGSISPPSGFSGPVDASIIEVDRDVTTQIADLQALQHQQRLAMTVIPVFRGRGKWSGKEFIFWVYGTDKAVVSNSYPAQLWCCLNQPKDACTLS